MTDVLQEAVTVHRVDNLKGAAQVRDAELDNLGRAASLITP